jgi:putative signal transducing protein
MVLVTLKSFDNELKAQLAKLWLDQANIESVLVDLETGSMYGFPGQQIDLIRLQVRDQDLVLAQEVLESKGNSTESA